jgi:hypothetical protein
MKDQRSKFVEKLSAQIVEWDVQMEQLRDKAEASSAEARMEYFQIIDTLQVKRDQAAEKLRGIGMASEDDWEDMKDGADQIWDEVKGFFRETIKKVG